jgi:hypothetical protein
MAVDTAFNGSGYYDNDGDMVSNGPETWTSIDCSTVTIP